MTFSLTELGCDVCRLEWFGLELKKLYVEHVIMPGEVNTHTGNRKPQKITTFIKVCLPYLE